MSFKFDLCTCLASRGAAQRARRLLVTALAFIGLGYGAVWAENGRPVYLPMTFHSEAEALRTSACLQVRERVYPLSQWWREAGGPSGAPERAFRAVLGAIERKDRAALRDLSHSTGGRDARRFDEQASAFFQQFELIHIADVSRAYAFDGLVVFYARVRSANRMFVVPFLFEQEPDGTFGFLPYRTERLTYLLVEDWATSSLGLAGAGDPTYCSREAIKRATHRFPLIFSSAAQKQIWQRSSLFLAGSPVEAPGPLSNLVTRLRSKLAEMEAVTPDKGVDDFAKLLTPEGANRLKQWFALASETERLRYAAQFRGLQPFFVFDASPVFIVYLRDRAGHIQVMYFTASASGELLWTNSSHLTVADDVFKQGTLRSAALGEKPFSSFEVK